MKEKLKARRKLAQKIADKWSAEVVKKQYDCLAVMMAMSGIASALFRTMLLTYPDQEEFILDQARLYPSRVIDDIEQEIKLARKMKAELQQKAKEAAEQAQADGHIPRTVNTEDKTLNDKEALTDNFFVDDSEVIN